MKHFFRSALADYTKTGGATNHTINLLRFVFSLVIVSVHLFHSSKIMAASESQSYYFYHGNSAVEFFFLVSGFLMAVSADRQIKAGVRDIGHDSMRFMLRKIGAVLLPMYVIWVISFSVYHIYPDGVAVKTVLRHAVKSAYQLLFLRNAGFSSYSVLGPTWYISGMFLTMLGAYPLALKLKDTYFYCVAPLIAAFLLGYLCHEYDTLVNVREYVGVIFKCQIRAIGVINLGIFLYAVHRWLKTLELTRFGTAVFSILELGLYGAALYYMTARGLENWDFYNLLALSGAILITFSQKTWLGTLTGRFPKLCAFLNSFSLYLYLSHGCLVAKLVTRLGKYYGPGKKTYCIGMASFFLMGLFAMLLTALVRKALPHVKKALVK